MQTKQLHAYAQEVERLTFLHDALTKRVKSLQADVEEARAAAAKVAPSVLASLLQSSTWEGSELQRCVPCQATAAWNAPATPH